MSLEHTIYDLLSTDSALLSLVPTQQINPTTPTLNQNLSYLLYSVTGSEQTTNLSGISPLVKSSLQIEIYTLTMTQLLNIMEEVRELLRGYRYGNIRLIKLESESTSKTEDAGSVGVMIFSVWYLI